jgi:N-acetylmuramoyl-L-alanine amidase
VRSTHRPRPSVGGGGAPTLDGLLGTLPLRRGDGGDAVVDLQRRLAGLGFPTSDPDGEFGDATEAAIRAFQEVRGLRTDGVCGEETWSSLVEAGHRLGDRLLSHRAPMLRGDDVAELQLLLGGLGFDAGRVDGILGPHTATAVVEFQRNVGLPTDGICGPDTVGALRRFAGRTGDSTVARLRETDAMRRARPGLVDRRVVVAEGGEAPALADAIGTALLHLGAVVQVVHHPDEHERANVANAFAADVFIGVVVRSEPGSVVAYYAHEEFESVGGRRLAELVAAGLPVTLPDGSAPAHRGMRLPVLRETRMPAIVVELGPPEVAVHRAPALVRCVAEAISRWATEPIE